MDDVYYTIDQPAQGFFKDKGSKFFTYIYPIKSEEEAKHFLDELKKEHHSARHHCYAWRLGTEEITFRANDDGEPSSTAGRPILNQLMSAELTNVFCVVVRYFGGTLLGVSGLINAYKSATIDAINNADIKKKLIKNTYRLQFGYNQMNDVMQLIKKHNLDIVATDFQITCSLDFTVRKSEAEKIEDIFNDFFGVEIEKI